MLEDTHCAIAANRFGLGARPGELAAVGADPRGWLRAQLRGAPPQLSGWDLRDSQETLAQALELRRDLQQQRNSQSVDAALAQAQLQKVGQFLKPIYVNEATARLAEAVASERPFLERHHRSSGPTTSQSRSTSSCSRGSPAASSARRSGRKCSGASAICCSRSRRTRRCCSTSTTISQSARTRRPRNASSAARHSARSASTRISRARSSSCTRSGSAAATPRPTSPPSPRSSPAGRSAMSAAAFPAGSRASSCYAPGCPIPDPRCC